MLRLGLPAIGPLARRPRLSLRRRRRSTCPLVLGSRSTQLRGAFGGLEGRALRQGDRLPAGAPAARRRPAGWRSASSRPRSRCRSKSTAAGRAGAAGGRIRLLHAGLARGVLVRALEGHAAERPLRLPAGRPDAGADRADGTALPWDRAGRHPGSAWRTADRADVRRPALRRLPEDRNGHRGRPLAARPSADRQPRPLHRDDLGRRAGGPRRNRAWLAEVRRLLDLYRARSRPR